MKKTISLLALALFGANLVAEELTITFGANADLAAVCGEHDLTDKVRLNGLLAKPQISVVGLNLDDVGTYDDRIDVQLAISAVGGKLARLALGYRLDDGHSLTFEIVSASKRLGAVNTVPIQARFASAAGNNRGSAYTTDNQGQRLLLTSTAPGNNRIRKIVIAIDLPADDAQKIAPSAKRTTGSPEMQKSRQRARSRPNEANTVPVKPPKAVAPPKIETESLLLPRLFCDDMILQQQTKNTFWGWAKPGEKIIVKASWGSSASAATDANGRWKLHLETPSFGTGHSLVIAGASDTVRIENVAIGEVWLCAGQSNMGWSVGNSFEAEKEADVNLPNFRIFKSAREHWHTPLEMPRDRLSQWKPCDSAAAAETSAVSYYFGKKLHLELGVPIGLIQQAFAGTPIEGWMPWEIQENDPRTQAHRATYDATAARQSGSGATTEKALADWQKELDEYNAHMDAGETMKNSVKPWSPPIITKPANLGHQYPAHQFNAMIYPIRPYGIRGAIWYQGERNSKDVPQAANYRKQLALLINYYRSSWHKLSDGGVAADFPFQFTQLPSWTPAQTQPVEGLTAPWVITREMMRLVTQDVPNTGMAVAIDTGDAVALHPKNKKPIGIRHAYLALKQTYDKDLVSQGPRYAKQTIRGDTIALEFDSIGSGMVPARSEALDTFAIAGKDRKWHWAEAKINGHQIIVSSPLVANPVAVRYAWGMNPSQRNLLYNKEGLPASPFRTDDWPLFDPTGEIVTVKKPAKPEDKTTVDWGRPKMTQ